MRVSNGEGVKGQIRTLRPPRHQHRIYLQRILCKPERQIRHWRFQCRVAMVKRSVGWLRGYDPKLDDWLHNWRCTIIKMSCHRHTEEPLECVSCDWNDVNAGVWKFSSCYSRVGFWNEMVVMNYMYWDKCERWAVLWVDLFTFVLLL